jgi:hypothetical protein
MRDLISTDRSVNFRGGRTWTDSGLTDCSVAIGSAIVDVDSSLDEAIVVDGSAGSDTAGINSSAI